MQARKIIICFDGTGNQVGDNESNILKLYKGLHQSDSQIVHYVPGIGTMEGPTLLGLTLWRKTKALIGLAFGMGLEDDVLDAYRFLCRTYRDASDKNRAANQDRARIKEIARELGTKLPPHQATTEAQDDQIYIFGFSRGAYAARILAGFIHNFGLVAPERLHMITEAFRAYRSVTDQDRDIPDEITFKALRQYEQVLTPNTRVPIRALCLFDTVASMARFNRPLQTFIKWRSPMELATHANVMRNRSVRMVLHALAVDERRSMFRALPWVPSDYYGNRYKQDRDRRKQYVEQRWFPGYHSDIGGSPREYFSGIGKITLLWMLDRLAEMERAADAEDLSADPPERNLTRPKTDHGLRLKQRYRRRMLEGTDPALRTPAGDPIARPDALAPIHASMKPSWWPLEILPKTTKRRTWPGRPGLLWYLPLGEPRLIPKDHTVDASVYERMHRWRFYRPVNVPPAK